MARETGNFEGTDFKQAVYEETAMPKETLSTRVHPFVAEQVERYAETHDLTRTETLVLFLETGLSKGDPEKANRSYTVRMTEERGDALKEWGGTNVSVRPEQLLEESVTYLQDSETEESVDESPVALSARVPPELVVDVVGWGERHDVSKAVAAEKLIERGLKWDPLPDGYVSENEGPSYTVELEPEEADMVRRWRLKKRYTPCRAFNSLAYARISGKDRTLWVPWSR